MRQAHVALMAVTLIYGLFYVAIKLLVLEIPPIETFTLRLIVASTVFFLLERLFFRTSIEKQDLVKIAGLGFLGITIVQLTAVYGLKYTTVFHAGFIVGLAPLVTLVITALLKMERFTWNKLIGILIALTGLGLLLSNHTAGQTPLPPTYLLGDLIIFTNIVGWSFFAIFSRPLLDKYPPFSLTAYTFFLSALLTAPWLPFLLKGIPGQALSDTGWWWMAYVIVFATLTTYFLNYFAIARVGASMATVYVLLQPLATAFFGHVILHEPVTPAMILEGAVIVLGVAIATGVYKPILERRAAKCVD